MKNKRRIRRKFAVTIGNKSCIVCAEYKSDAIERAVEKMFGANCFWFENYGIPGYGQVFRALRPTKNNSNPGNSSVTYQVRLDVDPLTAKSSKFCAQEKQDAIEQMSNDNYTSWEEFIMSLRS